MIIAKTIYIFAIYKFGSRLIIIVIRVYGGAFLLCNDIESIVIFDVKQENEKSPQP